MADDDVDSLDDGERWTGDGGDDDSFPATGEVKPVTCELAKTLPASGACTTASLLPAWASGGRAVRRTGAAGVVIGCALTHPTRR